MWHIHLDPPHTAAHWLSCPTSLPFPFKTRLEVPLCFCITLQTSHPYSHSPRRHVASAPHTLVTQPSTCVPCPHLSPPSQVCLCVASLTPAPSMPRPQLIPHPGPLPCPVNTRIQVLPISQGCLQMPILVLHQAIYHDYILYCSWPWVLPCPFGSELLDCGARFLLLHCLPCLKPKHLAPCWEVTQNPEACTGWTMLLHGHCPVVCHPSPSPGQDPIRQTSNGSEKIVDLGQVRVICQGSPTVKTQACPGVKETQFSHFPEHLVFGLELLNVCQMEKNWRSFSRGMTKGNSLESGIKSKEKRVNLAGKRVDTNPR